jgi:hypothetical protein
MPGSVRASASNTGRIELHTLEPVIRMVPIT